MKRMVVVLAVLLSAIGPAEAKKHGKTRVCGQERWAVKIGTDDDASKVGRFDKPTPATVAQLRSLQVPDRYNDNAEFRYAPVETRVYQVKALILGWKFSRDDSDYHIVIADRSGDDNKTMIAEIPCPCCVDRTESRFKNLIDQARADFDKRFNRRHRRPARFQRVDENATITGIGFFDHPHGQTGVAPNAIELHPVTGIQFN